MSLQHQTYPFPYSSFFKQDVSFKDLIACGSTDQCSDLTFPDVHTEMCPSCEPLYSVLLALHYLSYQYKTDFTSFFLSFVFYFFSSFSTWARREKGTPMRGQWLNFRSLTLPPPFPLCFLSCRLSHCGSILHIVGNRVCAVELCCLQCAC